MDEYLTLLNNPAIQLFIITNSLLVVVVALTAFYLLRGNSRAMNQISDANGRLSKDSSKLLDSALQQAKVANAATLELSAGVTRRVDEALDAITNHDMDAKKRHEQNTAIQQTIAETLKSVSTSLEKLSDTTQKQSELTESQASIMKDLSDADIRMHNAIETKIAPALDQIKESMQSLSLKIETVVTAGVQDKTELLEAMRGMQESFDKYSSLIAQQNKPEAAAAAPAFVNAIHVGIPTEPTSVDTSEPSIEKPEQESVLS